MDRSEGVELGEAGAALGAQRLRPIQHLRNPTLLVDGRQQYRKTLEDAKVNVRHPRSLRLRPTTGTAEREAF